MLLSNTCIDCIRTVLDEDLIPIICELEVKDTPALAVSRDANDDGYTEFTFLKSDLAQIMAMAKENPESWEFFEHDCMYDEGEYTCSCCGEVQPTMTVRFRTLITKDFVKAATIGIFFEWCEEFYWGRMNEQ